MTPDLEDELDKVRNRLKTLFFRIDWLVDWLIEFQFLQFLQFSVLFFDSSRIFIEALYDWLQIILENPLAFLLAFIL